MFFVFFVSGLCHSGDVCMFHCVVFVIVICHMVPFSESDRIFLQTSLQQKMGATRLLFVSSGILACHVVGRECFLLGKHRQTQRGILLQKSSPKCSVLGPLRTRHLPVGFTQPWNATSGSRPSVAGQFLTVLLMHLAMR